MNTQLLTCFLLLSAANPILRQPEKNPAVSSDLQAYYEKGTSLPWPDSIKKLTADQAEQRALAAKYLVTLLDQAQTDELSGKAPWRATPFWGSSGENPARNLRQQLARELAKGPASAATLSVVRWYLDHEKVPRHQEAVLPALDHADAKDAGAFCLTLLQPPHANSVVVLAALAQVGKRKTELPAAVMTELCDHYRPSLREAARKLNKERGGADPGPFDAVKAVQRPAVAALVNDIGTLLAQPAAPDADFVKVTSTWKGDKNTESTTTLGWLVKNDGDAWALLTPFGHRETFRKEQTTRSRRGGEWVTKNSWEKYPIADEVKRVVALRAKGDPDFGLSERGGLTGQFQGGGAGVYEVTIAHWLYTAKQFDLSAQLLLPAIDSLYMDRHLVDMIRQRIGEVAGYRMLVAFAGDRDFAETQRLAAALVQRYPGTRFHDHAVKLSKEMPKRQDDFKKLKLPTPEEWAALKKKLNRVEQITFLSERLRLLNCFQTGQPGGYAIREGQFAEPCGLSRNAAWGLGRGETKVINPYVVLMGGSEGYGWEEEKKPAKGMELNVADIQILAPFLRDDWHLLCVSFWRDFSADRHLDTTRPLLAGIINNIAKKDICSAPEMAAMKPAELEKEIERIIGWARKNSGRAESTLLLEGLEAEWRPGKVHWYWLKPRLSRFVELKEKAVVSLLQRRLDDAATAADELCLILFIARQLDADSFKTKAEKLLKHDDLDVQLKAALLLYATGERKQSHEAFARVLGKGRLLHRYYNELHTSVVLDVLIKERTPESRKLIEGMFANPRLLEMDWTRCFLLRILADANYPDSYRFYLPLLDIKGNKYAGHHYAEGVVMAEVIADEITGYFGRDDPDIQRITKTFPKASDQIAPLKEWLKAKARAVEKQQRK